MEIDAKREYLECILAKNIEPLTFSILIGSRTCDLFIDLFGFATII